MTSRRSAASATQLELPLPAATTTVAAGARRDRRGSPPAVRTRAGGRARKGPVHRSGPFPGAFGDDGSRLDEQTRRVGRRGIAAARALLAATEPGTDPVPSTGDRGAAGRAA